MFRSVQAEAARRGDSFVHAERAHVKSEVMETLLCESVNEVDPRLGALRYAPQRAPRAPPSG